MGERLPVLDQVAKIPGKFVEGLRAVHVCDVVATVHDQIPADQSRVVAIRAQRNASDRWHRIIALGTDAPLLPFAWLANSAAHHQRCDRPCRRVTLRDPLKAVRLEAL